MADDASMVILKDQVINEKIDKVLIIAIIFIKGHFGVPKDEASFASSYTRPDPEHLAGGQLKDHRGGDGGNFYACSSMQSSFIQP